MILSLFSLFFLSFGFPDSWEPYIRLESEVDFTRFFFLLGDDSETMRWICWVSEPTSLSYFSFSGGSPVPPSKRRFLRDDSQMNDQCEILDWLQGFSPGLGRYPISSSTHW